MPVKIINDFNLQYENRWDNKYENLFKLTRLGKKHIKARALFNK